MPLWLAIPATGALWLWSWISTLDPIGSFEGSYLLWTLTAFATGTLLLRLMRSR